MGDCRRGVAAKAAWASATRLLELGTSAGHDCDFACREAALVSMFIISVLRLPGKPPFIRGMDGETQQQPAAIPTPDACRLVLCLVSVVMGVEVEKTDYDSLAALSRADSGIYAALKPRDSGPKRTLAPGVCESEKGGDRYAAVGAMTSHTRPWRPLEFTLDAIRHYRHNRCHRKIPLQSAISVADGIMIDLPGGGGAPVVPFQD